MTTESIDKLYLELSQFTKAKTKKEIACEDVIRDLCETISMLLHYVPNIDIDHAQVRERANTMLFAAYKLL